MFSFRHEPEPGLGLIGRFSQAKRVAALRASVSNIIAAADTPQDFAAATPFADLAHVYRVADGPALGAFRDNVLRDAITGALNNDKLTTRERHELSALATWLGSPASAVASAIEAAGAAKYQGLVAEALIDDHLSPDETQALTSAVVDLGLSTDRATAIFQEAATAVLLRWMEAAAADGIVTEDEEQAIARHAAALGVGVPTVDEMPIAYTRGIITQYFSEGGELPALDDSGITLQRGESAHFTFPAALAEDKHVTVRTDYAGARSRVRVTRHLSFYAGSVKRAAVKELQRVPIDRGLVVLTSRRIVLDGVTRNHVITHRSIVDYQVYSDGLRVGRSSGGDLWYVADGDTWHAPMMSALMGRLLGGGK